MKLKKLSQQNVPTYLFTTCSEKVERILKRFKEISLKIRDSDNLPFIILLVFTLGSFTEEDHNTEDDNLCHYSHKGVEGGQGVLDSQQDLLLVTVLVLGHVTVLSTLPGQHCLAHVVLSVLGEGGTDDQSGAGDTILLQLLNLSPLLQGGHWQRLVPCVEQGLENILL